MVVADTLTARMDCDLHFHCDIGNDVLYLRRVESRGRESFGEETRNGVLFRDAETDEPVGWTVVNWWKILVGGPLPDSCDELTRRIEVWARSHPI